MARFFRRYFWHLAQAALLVGTFAASFRVEFALLRAEYPTANIGDLSNKAASNAVLAAILLTAVFIGLCLLVESLLRRQRRNKRRRVVLPSHGRALDKSRVVGVFRLVDQDARKPGLLEDIPRRKQLR